MRSIGSWSLVLACAISFGIGGCKKDEPTTNNNNNNMGQDAGVDGGGVDAGRDAGPAPGCTGISPAQPVDIGGCCVVDDDCVSGNCLGGYCTVSGCADDTECGPGIGGPWAPETEFHCNTNQINFTAFCAPGSHQVCGGAADPACPTGEICTLGWNEAGTDQQSDVMSGICITAFTAPGVLPSGSTCDENADPYEYQCENPGYIFLGGCVGRRCTEACDPTNPTTTCPSGLECIGPIAIGTGSGPIIGGGVCGGAQCGIMQFTGGTDDVRIPGRDSECPTGEVCLPMFFTGASGDTYEMRCVPENTSLGAPGDACEQEDKFQLWCNHSGLCLQNRPVYNIGGTPCETSEDCGPTEVCDAGTAGARRCGPKPDPGFCSTMCRTDADCPTMNGETAYCVNVGAGNAPNGQRANFTACFPESEIFDTTPTPCESEAECTDPSEGCLRVSSFSDFQACDEAIPADINGASCTVDASCLGGEACIANADDTASFCTAVKALGSACDSTKDECLSGFCFDTELEIDDNGTPTNTFCSAPCLYTTDCGANMVCENIRFATNVPADDTDDVDGGLCRPMQVRTGTGCSTVAQCGAGESCDDTTGRCYTAGTPWGAACTGDSDCDINGLCDTNAPGGMCYLPGCDSLNGTADCNNQGGSVCSDNNLVGVCSEACTTTCSRSGEGYVCVNGACEAP